MSCFQVLRSFRAVGAAGLVMAVVLGAGCSSVESDRGASGGSLAPSGPVESQRGTFDSLDGFAAGADAVRLTGEERSVITNAEYRLTERCMADEGFDYPTPEAGLVVAKAVPFLSPDELRRSGYGFDWSAAARSFSSANDPNAQDPTADMSPERAAAYQSALNGPVDGPTATLQDPNGDASSLPLEGCSADARVELFGSVLNAARFARADLAISGEALSTELQGDSRYEQAKDLWQECMIGAGQDRDFVAPPVDYGFYILHSQMLVGVSSGAAGVTVDQEHAVARDDADCQESSGLYEVRETLLPQVRDRLYESIDVESAELDSFGRAVFERAKEIE